MEVERGAWAEINLDAVANNVREAKRLLKPTTKLCAVVKADAYGHGAVPVATEAVRNGADFFAVALSQEGIELRNAGIDKPILILGPMPIMPGVADNIVRYELSQAVFDVRRLEILNQAAETAGKKARVHIAVDTGMSRIGVQVDEAADFAKKVVAYPGIELEGIFPTSARPTSRTRTLRNCSTSASRRRSVPLRTKASTSLSSISPTARACPS